jgi:signal peptidase I
VSKLKIEQVANENQIQKVVAPTLVQEFASYTFYFLKVFLTVAIIFIFIRTNLFDLIGISGKSMFPNYNFEAGSSDKIYIDQISPKFSDFVRGDVVVFVPPKSCNPNRDIFIKRVIGLPGEKVSFQDGRVYITNNDFPGKGVILDESSYLPETTKTYKKIVSGAERFEEKVLGNDEYFLMGDNRSGSLDSRVCGSIQKNLILGKEFYRITPVNKAGFWKNPEYNISTSIDY